MPDFVATIMRSGSAVMRFRSFILSGALGLAVLAGSADAKPSAGYKGPIIDTHLHAFAVDFRGPAPTAVCVGINTALPELKDGKWLEWYLDFVKNPRCKNPIWSPKTDDELRDQTIAEMKRLNVTGIVSGPPDRVAQYVERIPNQVIPAIEFNLTHYKYTEADIIKLIDEKGYRVFGEITDQYDGIAPDDPRFDPFWKIAEDRGIPVAVHIGIGPPAAPHLTPEYRAHGLSPMTLERMLTKYPKLRVVAMHAAWPLKDEMKAILYTYPQVNVDTGSLQFALSRKEYHAFLRELVDAGFEDRIMFGSDQQVWPGLIAEGINAINEASFLTLAQKKKLLHDNAVRFFKLPK
ncbi:MAG: amidohydrolase family protein [Sphingomonadaceae bacterium]|nr:amidohydrolase family protein [Sphingomonadaceae bacterium]